MNEKIKTTWIKKIKVTLVYIALIGAAFSVLSGLIVYYCVTDIIPLFSDLLLRTNILLTFTGMSIIASITGFHLLIDASTSARSIESRIESVGNEV